MRLFLSLIFFLLDCYLHDAAPLQRHRRPPDSHLAGQFVPKRLQVAEFAGEGQILFDVFHLLAEMLADPRSFQHLPEDVHDFPRRRIVEALMIRYFLQFVLGIFELG